MPNKNRVQLIIIGINLSDLNSNTIVVDRGNILPNKEILEETIERCRDILFKEIIGYDAEWTEFKLTDVFKTGEFGLTVVYASVVPTDIKLLNDYKFIPLNGLKASDIGEH